MFINGVGLLAFVAPYIPSLLPESILYYNNYIELLELVAC